MITQIIFLIILIAVNAFFAASEIALISLNDNKIKLMAEAGDKKAVLLIKLLGEPSRFLATIQIGITLAGFLASAFAAESFADPLVGILRGFNIPLSESVLKVSTVTVITIILSYFTLVFGELVPKRVAMKKAEGIAFSVVKPLVILSRVTNPFVKFLTASTNFCVRLFGIDPDSTDDDVTEEEIRMLIDVGEEKGAIDQSEKRMINNIFEFNDKKAEDIMTHRMELTGVASDTGLKELIDIVREEQYSRIPVYEGSIDNVVGILNVKDLLTLISSDTDRDFSIGDYMRKPYYIPMNKKVDELFRDLQSAQTHMAVVIDEYGGTAGVVTLEDLLEEIVGNIFDEYDKDEDIEIRQIDENTYEASGMIGLDELEETLEAELPVEEFETLSGFLISLCGRIPSKDEMCEIRFKNLVMQVTDATDKRIEKVIIRIEVNSDFNSDLTDTPD